MRTGAAGKRLASSTAQSTSAAAPSQMPAESRIEITGSASLIVEGEVNGRVQLENEVSVGREGLVTGEIDARAVRIGGRVRGNIRGADMIEILQTGSVEGDVRSPRVVIADGAFFKGKVEMGMGGSSPAGQSSLVPTD